MAKRSARLAHLLSLAAIGTAMLGLAAFVGEQPAMPETGTTPMSC
jgi:hypothetical protein